MCGISGIINFNKDIVNSNDLKLMIKNMKHRGPDDEGIYIHKNVGFGFVRLSILDLSRAGHQPMYSNDGRYVIVYNGEVYNYLELKQELNNDFIFKTKTDTEVVLASYQKWGDKCLDKFNGMFSFVIYDIKKNKVFGARDRYGIKPLFYYKDDKKFIFSSEIKSILPFIVRSPNDKVIYDYLIYNRLDHTNETFFDGVFKINHGHYFEIEHNKLNIKKWYNLKLNIMKNKISNDEYRELFVDSLKLRLRSDVPVGVCLSGGMDSSVIVSSLINNLEKYDLNTFSAVYHDNEPSNENEYINEFKSIVNNMYKIYPSSESLQDDYIDFITAHTQPVTDIGPYIQYKVMELAKDYVKVTIDGQGADEQLAGYHNFFGSYFVELIKQKKYLKFILENYHYYKNHKSLSGIAYFKTFYEKGSGNNLNKAALSSIRREFVDIGTSNKNIDTELYNHTSLLDHSLKYFEYNLEHLLRWEDINSMHFSIESRVPFLDYRLVENTLSLPAESIIYNGNSKYILRESMKKILPKKIYYRKDKKGFSSPRDKWFRSNSFKILISDLISSNTFMKRGYFNPDIAASRYEKHLSGKFDISKEIWKWINLEIWFQNFID